MAHAKIDVTHDDAFDPFNPGGEPIAIDAVESEWDKHAK